MILATERVSEQLACLGQVHCISSSTALSTSYVSVANYARLVAVIITGLAAATATFNAKLEQATSSGGAGVKDITGKAIAALDDTTGDNTRHLIDLRADELDLANGFTFVRLTLTPATAAVLIAGLLLGVPAGHLPTSTSGWTSLIN